MQDKVKEVQSERFVLKDISCSDINNGDCSHYSVTLKFNDDMLDYKKISNLIDDLYKVGTFLKEELQNKGCSVIPKKGDLIYKEYMSCDRLQTRDNIEDFVKNFLLQE